MRVDLRLRLLKQDKIEKQNNSKMRIASNDAHFVNTGNAAVATSPAFSRTPRLNLPLLLYQCEDEVHQSSDQYSAFSFSRICVHSYHRIELSRAMPDVMFIEFE